MYLCTRLL